MCVLVGEGSVHNPGRRWRNGTEKERSRQPVENVLLSLVPLSASGAYFRRESSGTQGREHSLELPHPMGEGAGVLIHQLPQSLSESCSWQVLILRHLPLLHS